MSDAVIQPSGLPEGIRRGTNGHYRVYVKAKGVQRERRFPAGASLAVMQEWRRNALRDIGFAHQFPQWIAPPRLVAADAWCYVYVVGAGEMVKVGRAKDVAARMKTLQGAQPFPLRLIVAVPGHPSLEAAIHERFSNLRAEGEWFRLDPELKMFIRALRAGLNPFALLVDPACLNEFREPERPLTIPPALVEALSARRLGRKPKCRRARSASVALPQN